MIEQDSGQLVIDRKKTMKNSGITMLDNGEIIPNTLAKQTPNAQKIIVRKIGRDGRINEKAKALSQCKGLKGCDAAQCMKKALGNIPYNNKKNCPNID